ncbi:SH3 domain-containing protein [Streptomyces sp. NPDC059466]|uniref:SH3 domain-containing protein n=1 Tax=unclassified Streptomyces TaxID=2593676 RepID=UPI0036CD1325
MPTSRLTARAALAGAALALGLLMAQAASAAPVARADAIGTTASDTYTVTARTDTYVYAGPGLSYPRQGSLRAGRTYRADCWLMGDVVSGDGRSSGVWVHLLGDKDIGAGFVDVVFLQGDDHAGLPGSARC